MCATVNTVIQWSISVSHLETQMFNCSISYVAICAGLGKLSSFSTRINVFFSKTGGRSSILIHFTKLILRSTVCLPSVHVHRHASIYLCGVFIPLFDSAPNSRLASHRFSLLHAQRWPVMRSHPGSYLVGFEGVGKKKPRDSTSPLSCLTQVLL